SPTLTGQLYCYPPDVDALWDELKDKVEIAWPIDNMIYGMREFAIRDCNGYVITFGQDIEEMPG
ncbi:MAG: bleomycin resistance family protein, partial [Cyanobacteria bacterium P01_F01_bin.4]